MKTMYRSTNGTKMVSIRMLLVNVNSLGIWQEWGLLGPSLYLTVVRDQLRRKSAC